MTTDAPAPVGRDPLLTAKEVASLLRLSERTVRRMIADGQLSVVRIGRSVRIRPGALDEMTGDDR
jgi:excisionase family DNA binding protein